MPKDEIEELIAERIAQARGIRRLSQRAAGELIGVDQTTWATYENRTRGVSAAMLVRIAKALSIPLDFFVERDYQLVVKGQLPKAKSPGARARKDKVPVG